MIPHLRGVPKQPLEVVRIADPERLGLRTDGVEAIDADLLPGADVLPARSQPVGTQHSLPLSLTPPPAGAPTRPHRANLAPRAAKPTSPPPATTVPDPTQGPVAEPAATPSATAPPSESGTLEGAPPSSLVRELPGPVESTTVAASAAAQANAAEPVAMTWDALARFGEAGSTFLALAQRLSAQPDWPGVMVLEEGVALAYPDAITPFCAEPQQFLMSCESQGLVVRDRGDGGRIVRSRRARGPDAPEQYIVLSPRVARYLPIRRSS